MALLSLLLLSLAACAVSTGEPPVFMLMNADEIDYERDIEAIEEYQAPLTEIFIRTAVPGWIPEAEIEAAEIILETRGLLDAKGVDISALELTQGLVDRMPNEDEVYDLREVADEYLTAATPEVPRKSVDRH